MAHRADNMVTLVEAVRAACLNAAVLAYEDAGIRGLCAEGRWEAAMAAIGQLDLSHLIGDQESHRGSERAHPDG